MRRTFVPLLALALTTLGAAQALAGSVVWPSTSGLIAFRSDRDGEADVFTVDPANGSTTKLTGPGADVQPAVSPEGDRIVFARPVGPQDRPDLFAMGIDGSARTRLTSTIVPERDPSWSPDGTRIVYAARTSLSGPFRLFVANADGSGRVQLTEQPAGEADRAPAWSPDGSSIAFVSDRDGGFPEIYLIGAEGGGLERLTNNAGIDGNPAWSPDGTRIAIERCCAKNGTSDIVTIDVATRAEANLTPTTDRQEFDPSWSPDGTTIAFVAFEVGSGNIDIWTMNADGSNATRLTQDAAADLSPDWQPLPTCTISGTSAADDLRGTEGDDVLCGLGGDDHLRGGLGRDLVLGGNGADLLEGQLDADLVQGEGGDDTLRGGPGYDVLDGGPGTDQCVRGADGAARRRCEA